MTTEAKSTESPIVHPAGAGEVLWFNNDLLTIKASSEETGSGFAVFEELSRHGKTTPLHTHPAETETFYVLEGQATFHVDGDEFTLGAGGFASVPPGVPHAYLVTSETARTLILITPDGGPLEAFFREAGEPASERKLPPEAPLDLERIGAAAAKTGAVEILGPPPFAS